jgi:hypothetical protein
MNFKGPKICIYLKKFHFWQISGYAIDVTFNGLQVHGCPIKVDVRERQVGKPVSAPVYARPATSGSK